MRLVLLSQWFYPEPEPKVRLMARDLTARGHQVTVVTGIPNYPSGNVYEGYRLRPWPQRETVDGVPVVRVPLYCDHSRSASRRVLNYASFALSAALFGPPATGPADLLWVYHPPLTVAIPALAVAKARRIPFIYDVNDLWPETLQATGMFRSSLGIRLLGDMAKAVYRRAARVTVVSPGFKVNLVAKGVPTEKIEVIPNWADEDVYRPVDPDPALARELGMDGRFNVFYAGNIGAAQHLDNLFDALGHLRDLPNLQVVFAGHGIDEARLRVRAERERLCVRFLGMLPPQRVVAVSAVAQVLLVHLKRDPLFEITIPSKTLSALACGRPVLTVSEGDAAEVVTSGGAGLACPPGDPLALARSLRQLHDMPEGGREAMGRAAHEHFLHNFSRTRIMPRYEALFSEVVAEAARLTGSP